MNKLKKITLITLLSLLILTCLMIALSPYGNKDGSECKLVIHTVKINASADSVFHFLGNSNNAKRWSVYVNHITPLNSDSVADGQPGSTRRCFQNANEQGIQWDELITVVEPGKRRQLTIYNMQNFSMQANNLATEQLYEAVDNNTCKLSFTLFYCNAEPTLFESLKTYFAAYIVKNIYQKNMENIKRIVETGK